MRWTATVLLLGCAGARWDPAHPTPGGPPPPELLSPAEGETFEEARPTFRWRLPRGVDGGEAFVSRSHRCNETVARAAARGEAATVDHDLASGGYAVCVRSTVGALTGPWTPARRFAVNVKAGVGGRHVDVIVPVEQRAFAEKMVALGDRALEAYAQILGVGLPENHCRVYFYLSMKTIEEIALKWTHNRPETEAVTYPSIGSHIYWAARIDRPTADAEGETEYLTLHELAHSFESKQVRLFSDHPKWLVEGMAEFLPDAFLSAEGRPPETERAARLYQMRALARDNKVIPLAELLAIDRRAHFENRERMNKFYIEVIR